MRGPEPLAKMDKRVLIVGAGGFLGRSLCEIPVKGVERVPAMRTIRPPHAAETVQLLDLRSEEQVTSVVNRVRPAWVINAAALTSVDGCENEPDEARQMHVDATGRLARACRAAESGLITISTNYVFDGEGGPYRESDPPRPLNVYGRTKLEGEACALGAGCPSIVVRTAVLYGYQPGCRPNFVTWAAGSVARGSAIRVVSDEWANPTHVDELAVFLFALCDSSYRGVVHFAGPDYLTRYEMVAEACDCFGLDMKLVTAVTSADLGQPAKRPLRAGLNVGFAGQIVPDRRRTFRESLELMREQMPPLSSLS